MVEDAVTEQVVGEIVEEEVLDLLERFRNKQPLTEEEREKLFSFLSQVPDVKGFVFGHGYTIRDYSRLMKAMQKAGVKKRKAEVGTEIDKVRTEREREWARRVADIMWRIGADTVMRWYHRAAEVGYFDEASGTVDMSGFLRDAVEFYLSQAPKFVEMKEEIVALRAAIEYLSKRYSDLLDRLAAARAALDVVEELNKDIEGIGMILMPVKRALEVEVV